MSRPKICLLLVAMALTCFSEPTLASHPFHVTRAEVEYNAKRQTFEVAVCVWPEDLERAVSKTEKRDVKIDLESEASRDEMFCRYVAKKFQFVANSNTTQSDSSDQTPTAAKIRWVGSELEVKQGWLYFEVDAKTDASGWSIENKMFFELNDDQLNQVQIRNGKLMDSQTLSAIQTTAQWTHKPLK